MDDIFEEEDFATKITTGTVTRILHQVVPYWPMVAAIIVWIFSAGMLLGKFNALKDSLERRLGALEATVVRADKLDDKLEVMAAKIESVHKLLEQSDRNWRESLHGAKE